jgi:hypothetical protein
MSVDYYSCDCCGDSRYEEYVYGCPVCGRDICNHCTNENVETPMGIDQKDDLTEEQYLYLCNKYGKEMIDKYVIGYGEMNPEYCPFCGGNKVHDEDLLNFALDKLGITKEQLKDEYLKSK